MGRLTLTWATVVTLAVASTSTALADSDPPADGASGPATGERATEPVVDVVLDGGEFEMPPPPPRRLPSTFTRPLVDVLDEPSQGAAAITGLGDRLADAAARNQMSVARLRALLRDDPAAWLDRDGALFYAEPDVDLPQNEEPLLPSDGPFPYGETFALHSKPGSQRTIFLDFDGHTVSGTAWQAQSGAPDPFVAIPFDTDGDPTGFSTSELDAVQSIWQRVAEDFAPLDVDVTTEDPGDAAINRSSFADQVYGTRVVVTSSASICSSPTGCAYVGAFDYAGGFGHGYYQPAWAWASGIAGYDTKSIAEVTSHEAGHNLGLLHDGPCPAPQTCEYYLGHAMWAPIMGAGYYEPVVQFSSGEYAGATNTEDDWVVMAGRGGVLRADDHSNSTATATVLTDSDEGIIVSETDLDAFRYTATVTGTATIDVLPAPVSPNLDVILRLFGSDGTTLLATSAPTVAEVNRDVASGMEATLTFGVTAGQDYYLQVGGDSFGTGATGYTEFGSVGQFSISVQEEATTPVNDDFADAIELSAGAGTLTASNVASTAEPNEPSHGDNPPGKSVWWTFTAPDDGVLHIDTEGSDFDTTLGVYTGADVGALTEVASNDDHPAAGPGSEWSVVDPVVAAGVTYAVAVDGSDDDDGSITLTWSFGPPPASCGGLAVTVDIGFGQTPTNGSDVILGTESADVIDGLDGDDTICGLGGDDVIDGGLGLDTIFGGGGADTIDGGKGIDSIFGGAGNDDLYGAGGSDVIHGEGDDDLLRGGNGNDTLEGGPGVDEIRGQNGSDIMYANGASDSSTTDVDTVYGGGLYDDVFGDAGNDIVYGGNFADILSGKGGDDSLFGNNGADVLRGGPHNLGDECNGGTINSGSGDTASACETSVNVP